MTKYGLIACRKGIPSKEINIYDVSWYATLAVNTILEKEAKK